MASYRQEDDLGVLAAAHQERREEAAGGREEREAQRAVRVCGQGGARGDEHHQAERGGAANQAVEGERREHGNVERGEPAPGHDLPVERVATAGDAMAAQDHRQADRGTDEHAPRLVNPVVVERVLDEEPDADDERGRADVEEPAAANAALEGLVELGGGSPRGSWRRDRSLDLPCELGELHGYGSASWSEDLGRWCGRPLVRRATRPARLPARPPHVVPPVGAVSARFRVRPAGRRCG